MKIKIIQIRDIDTHTFIMDCWNTHFVHFKNKSYYDKLTFENKITSKISYFVTLVAGSLESANSSILAARRHFKEVVGKKIRILLQ